MPFIPWPTRVIFIAQMDNLPFAKHLSYSKRLSQLDGFAEG